MNQFYKLAAFVGLGLVCLACGPQKEVPSAPSSESNATPPEPKSTTASAAQRTSSGEQLANNKGEYAGWGAHAGTTNILARLAECNQKGNFFDRAADNGRGTCDVNRKILGNCNTFDAVKGLTRMDEGQIQAIEKMLVPGGVLDGFLFDQCIDAGAKAEVLLVMQKSNGDILINRLHIDIPK